MLELASNAFVTLLVVLDPLGMAPLFVTLTRGRTEAYKRKAAMRGTAVGAAILLFFALGGQGLLSALGIGVPAFRIAGGALLFLLSLDMVFARPSGIRRATVREHEEADEENGEDISIFPLAIPLIAGPGALTTLLLYTGNGDSLTIVVVLGVLLAILLLVLASMLFASRITRVFGETGANVFSRVLGVLLAALAVQFVLDGIRTSFDLG